MAHKNSQNRSAKPKKTKHVQPWTGPKPPAKVRPVSLVEPKPVQPETKPDNRPVVTPEAPKSETPKPQN